VNGVADELDVVASTEVRLLRAVRFVAICLA
jgi:hypothetical protein